MKGINLNPRTILLIFLLVFVVTLLGPQYVPIPQWAAFFIGVLWFASVAGLLYGAWLSSNELREYVGEYFDMEDEQED